MLFSFLFQVFTSESPLPTMEPLHCWREPAVAQAALPQALGCRQGSELQGQHLAGQLPPGQV